MLVDWAAAANGSHPTPFDLPLSLVLGRMPQKVSAPHQSPRDVPSPHIYTTIVRCHINTRRQPTLPDPTSLTLPTLPYLVCLSMSHMHQVYHFTTPPRVLTPLVLPPTVTTGATSSPGDGGSGSVSGSSGGGGSSPLSVRSVLGRVLRLVDVGSKRFLTNKVGIVTVIGTTIVTTIVTATYSPLSNSLAPTPIYLSYTPSYLLHFPLI